MFTGIITDVGAVISREAGRFTLSAAYRAESIAVGASIACDGCCLTVTRVTAHGSGANFSVDVSNETLSKTTLGDWVPGRRVNLERALCAGDELGGHIVTGHVDGVATILAVTADGESLRLEIEAPAGFARFIAKKGSVALDGTSLTVNDVSGNRFSVNLVPHTLTVTTWGRKKAEDRVNLEIDPLARYVARLMETLP